MVLSIASLLKIAFCATTIGAMSIPQPRADANGTVGAPNANIPPSQTTDLTGTVVNGTFTAKPAPDTQSDASLQKRVAPLVVVGGIVATKGAIILTKIAIEVGADTIKNLGEWNAVRSLLPFFFSLSVSLLLPSLLLCGALDWIRLIVVRLTRYISASRLVRRSPGRRHKKCGLATLTTPSTRLPSATTRPTTSRTLLARTVFSVPSSRSAC